MIRGLVLATPGHPAQPAPVEPLSQPGVVLHPAHDVCRAHGTRLARYFMPIPEQGQCGNAANIEPRAQVGHGFSVYLDQPDVWLQLCRCLHIGRCHGTAGTAPGGPKIDQHRDLVAADVFVKRRFVERCRVPVKQRLFAAAASRRAAKLVCPDTVGGVAVGANDVEQISHVGQFGATGGISSGPPAVGVDVASGTSLLCDRGCAKSMAER